ncbi:helicase associated domain-containing protein [Streptomyces sp. NPDC001568]|uniref:helicase associated domain-containing protein n=1 Tax=Streptomyces sp. NPDC001568 TaxID=3364588 RepID=UPI0036924AE9
MADRSVIDYSVINTEPQGWRRGPEAASRYRKREGHLDVLYEHTEGAYPLGRWFSDQRRPHGPGAVRRVGRPTAGARRRPCPARRNRASHRDPDREHASPPWPPRPSR